MASYTATKNPSGAYDVSYNGIKVSTTAAGGLQNFGLSENQLTSSPTTDYSPDNLSYTTQPGTALGSQVAGQGGAMPTNIPDYSGGASSPTTTTPTTTSPTDTSAFANPTPTPKDATATPGSASTALLTATAGAVTPPTPQAATTLAPGTSITDLLNSLGSGQDIQKFGTAGDTGTAAQNQALSQKYTALFDAKKSTAAPNTNPREDIQNGTQAAQQADPQQNFFDQYGSMNPVVKQLYDMTQSIMSPQNTQQTFTQEYQTLTQGLGIPGLQTQLLNIQNVMSGTVDDIRTEVTKAGGTATESQVQALAATRNNVLMKQASALSNTLSMQEDYVGQIMQFSQADQSQVNTQVNEKTGLLETMASLQQTMNQNSLSNYQKTLTTVGGDYGAFASTIPDNMKPTVENLMGLAPGTLSDPGELQILTNSSLKLLQLQISAQRANVYAYNAGLPASGVEGVATDPVAAASVSPFSSNNPINKSQSQNTYTVQQGDGLRAIGSKFGITSDAGLQALASVNGIQDINKIQPGQQLEIPVPVKDNSTGQTGYISQNDYDPAKYTQIGGTPIAAPSSAVDKAYQSMQSQVKTAQATPVTGSPLNKGRLTRNANSALKNYLASPVYAAVSSGATYLARIQAAMKDPGSISDTSLADAIIKIETGGGQVTDSQISTYFAGQSYADKFAVQGDKVTAKGGVLSPQQRTDLSQLATDVFSNYQQQYEQLYVQAMQNLQGQGIPLNYGGNLPDFLGLISSAPTATE